MEDTSGCRTKYQGQTMATMTADHSEIDTVFLGKFVHLLGWLSDHHVSVSGSETQLLAKLIQANAGLLFHLGLDFAEIHGDIATIGKGQRLLDMEQAHANVSVPEQFLNMINDQIGLW